MQRLSTGAITKYMDNVRMVSEKYKNKIEIFCGFELSYGKHFEDRIMSFLERSKADYCLGAIHCLENIGITAGDEAAGYLRTATAKKCSEDYIRATMDLVESGIFKTVAHIDGIKKYARSFFGNEIDSYLEELFPPIFKRMASLGVGIEINTSSLRRGHPDAYPSPKLIEMAKRYSVNVHSIGSDAHSENEVGYKFDVAFEMIAKSGIGVGEPLKKYYSTE